MKLSPPPTKTPMLTDGGLVSQSWLLYFQQVNGLVAQVETLRAQVEALQSQIDGA